MNPIRGTAQRHFGLGTRKSPPPKKGRKKGKGREEKGRKRERGEAGGRGKKMRGEKTREERRYYKFS